MRFYGKNSHLLLKNDIKRDRLNKKYLYIYINGKIYENAFIRRNSENSELNIRSYGAWSDQNLQKD